jgi:hypothetical protein
LLFSAPNSNYGNYARTKLWFMAGKEIALNSKAVECGSFCWIF